MLQRMRRNASKIFAGAMIAYGLCFAAPAFAQATAAAVDPTIDVNGTDNSANLGAINNMSKTLISILVNVVARVVGVGLAVFAIFQFVKREIVWGVVNFALCGICFFLPNIILALSHMG